MQSQLDLNILKTLLTNKKYAIEFSTECSTNLFEPNYWNFANAIVGYIKTFKEIPTERVLLEKIEQSKKNTEYFSNLWKEVNNHSYNDQEFKFDLEKLKQRFAEKQLALLQESLAKTEGKAALSRKIEEIQKTVQSIKSLSEIKSFNRFTLKESIPTFRDEFNAKLKNYEFDSGILTGYSALDSATGGLREGELLLIGGESGGGKSLLLMNMAIQMWMQSNTIDMTDNFAKGYDILYFSLEMPFKPCRNRVLSRLSGVPSKLIRTPMGKDGKVKVSMEEKNKLKQALRFINNYPHQFEIIDIPRGATIEKIERLYEETKLNFDPKIVIIDYIGIMDATDNNQDDWLKLGTIAGQCHEFCRTHNLIGLSAVQLNRMKSSKDSEEKIGLHRIGRSALIMHHANIGIQIETRQNEKQYPDMIYHLIKNRDGEQVKGRLLKNLSCGSLLDDKTEEESEFDFNFTDFNDISEKMDELDI